MDNVKVPGIAEKFGDRTLVVPPLNFRALKALGPRLSAFSGEPSMEHMDLVADVLELALRRNYTDTEVTREFIEECLDVSNMVDLMQSAMDVGGMKRKESEASQAGPSTGTSSSGS